MDYRVKEVIVLVRRDLKRDVHANKMAHHFGLSVSRFYHLFKDETGTTLGQYQRQLRLKRACQLLENTHLSVKEIMGQVGALDASHFTRNFKKTYGTSPKRYRLDFLSRQKAKKQPGIGNVFELER